MEFRREAAGQPVAVARLGTDKVVVREFQDVADRNLNIETQHSDSKPSQSYNQYIVREDA